MHEMKQKSVFMLCDFGLTHVTDLGLLATYKLHVKNLILRIKLLIVLTYFLSVQTNCRLSNVLNDLMRGSKACKDHSKVILQFFQGHL